ncbi:ribokinase [Thermoflexus sp.]|uniref:ribokinase n=1 Tax=Thermoflexus sp. TaxID=1969742 RepID=UPI0035E442E4
MSVLVLGSINMDLVAVAPRFPRPGETLRGHRFFTAPGGKGANQAVAAARLQVPTRMIGRVGNDVFGPALRQALAGAGVDVEGVTIDPETSSGTALIVVEEGGQNAIVVIPGANGRVGATELTRLEQWLPEARVLLLQLEVPLEAVMRAAEQAARAGVTVILNPAPVTPLPEEIYPWCTWLTPNEVEAEGLVGFSLDDTRAIEEAARILVGKGCAHVVITLGERGCVYADRHEVRWVSSYRVPVVDTVAAGDAFNGALAAALWEGRSVAEALRWANAAGALSVTRYGAQPSMPYREELLAFLAQNPEPDGDPPPLSESRAA